MGKSLVYKYALLPDEIDRESLKIALSLRRLQPEPWEGIGDRFKIGEVVNGTVTKLANFGAFARIESGIEGLIHISEISPEVINHPKDVVKEGDVVELKIIRVEPERRRLGLSLKQVTHPELSVKNEDNEDSPKNDGTSSDNDADTEKLNDNISNIEDDQNQPEKT